MFVSVVIPIRNAVDRLRYTLCSLNLQYTPFDEFEVIIVDNGSTDGLDQKIQSFQVHYSLVYYRSRRRRMPHELLNIGIDKAHGDVIIFLGAGMIVPRHFIGTHLQHHGHSENLVLTGVAPRRAYSVYYPSFSQEQDQECHKWLETYPQVKRPHTRSAIVPLLDESQIASGLLFEIALPEISRPSAKRAPWEAFRTRHVSLKRSALANVGHFFGISGKLREVEKDMAKRLWRANYEFRRNDKLILVHQEHPKRKRKTTS